MFSRVIKIALHSSSDFVWTKVEDYVMVAVTIPVDWISKDLVQLAFKCKPVPKFALT